MLLLLSWPKENALNIQICVILSWLQSMDLSDYFFRVKQIFRGAASCLAQSQTAKQASVGSHEKYSLTFLFACYPFVWLVLPHCYDYLHLLHSTSAFLSDDLRSFFQSRNSFWKSARRLLQIQAESSNYQYYYLNVFVNSNSSRAKASLFSRQWFSLVNLKQPCCGKHSVCTST